MRNVIALLAVLLGVLSTAGGASAQCYVVYIHGKGADLSPGVVDDVARLNYWRRDANDSYANFVTYSRGGCTTLVAGYNGGAWYYGSDAAGRVATQINAFITQYNIQPGQLRIIAHSMGGLVARFILNNSWSGSAYYNYQGSRYDLIRQATGYFITVATPHLGSPAADAVYGTSDSLCGNFVGTIAGWLGARDNATDSLRRINLEYGSVPSGGWLSDRFRTTRMYTFATRRWSANGSNETNDSLLSGAWDCLGYVGHWYTFYGDTAGDGLVTLQSGRAQYERSGSATGSFGQMSWSSGTWVVGARTAWVEASFDHHQVRHDLEQGSIDNRATGLNSSYWPASYIGANGMQLAR